ncbi:zinc finger C2HC domain-containing protein 1B isoform X3 [Fukomys damarensis]|uniref:zinc finger C2HC domain-containing protein 1B isoform X3 n=1 Tax=Fukomys damarensis TaxID=885580 RepID=UPI00053F6345|nr:zinc finger C2HC domain-containing protein 1B isoform X3 [Fukomys damarensis]XP_010624920.1 zinc finger C2HC domain-containing protein 1B isoform X3 [Fukomys damarensis]
MSGSQPFLADGNQELFPCEVCGRRFAADVLKRHGPICRKLFHKKRKPFNSLKQRLQGTDIPTVRKAPQSKSQPVRKSNWRQQHADFINAIRSAKRCPLAMREGRPLPPPPPPSVSPDYIQCPYCMRRFNETAAGRHINFCKDQSSRRVFDPAQTAAKLTSRAQRRAQASPRKEPTVTRAVGALLQSRAMEAKNEVPTKSGSYIPNLLRIRNCYLFGSVPSPLILDSGDDYGPRPSQCCYTKENT